MWSQLFIRISELSMGESVILGKHKVLKYLEFIEWKTINFKDEMARNLPLKGIF